MHLRMQLSVVAAILVLFSAGAYCEVMETECPDDDYYCFRMKKSVEVFHNYYFCKLMFPGCVVRTLNRAIHYIPNWIEKVQFQSLPPLYLHKVFYEMTGFAMFWYHFIAFLGICTVMFH